MTVESLHDNRRDLKAVLDALAYAVLVMDDDGIVMFANPSARAMFSQRTDGLEGTVLGIPSELGRVCELEVPVAEGVVRNVELHVAPVSWDGTEAHAVTLRDITDRLRAEQLQQELVRSERLASIGRVTAGVAHEVNNPAAFVSCNLHMIRASLRERREFRTSNPLRPTPEFEDEMEQMVSECIDGVARIASIATDLRTFSSVCDEDVESVTLENVIATATKMLAGRLRTEVDFDVELDAVPPIPAHRGKLVQVVTNLLSNALDAVNERPRHARKISVRLRMSLGSIVLAVEDTGTGVPPELDGRVFEPFFTTKKLGQGTGLGLALSAEIAHVHHGDLRYRSREGQGTVFELTLPVDNGLRLSAPEPKPRDVRPTQPANAPRLRVLIVDDEPGFARAYRRLLEQDYDVVLAMDGEEARSRLRRSADFDIVLCDLAMPGLDGPALFEWVEASIPHYCDRFVFATGGAFTERAQRFLERIPNPVLHKPFSKNDLDQMIEQTLQRNRTPTAKRPVMELIRGGKTAQVG